MWNELKKKVDWNELVCTIMGRYTVPRKNMSFAILKFNSNNRSQCSLIKM